MTRSLLLAAAIFLPRLLNADDAAKPKVLSLWEKGKAPIGNGRFSDEDPQVTVYRAPKPNGTAIVICPGGGYGGHAIQPASLKEAGDAIHSQAYCNRPRKCPEVACT